MSGNKIYWTDFAKSELKGIFEYYSEKTSVKVAAKITKDIVAHTMVLINQLEIGAVEPLLKAREQGFRYLIHKNYKIIYWYNKNKKRIEISDVFDTRQNPIKLKRNK